jgi:hypothetical protein
MVPFLSIGKPQGLGPPSFCSQSPAKEFMKDEAKNLASTNHMKDRIFETRRNAVSEQKFCTPQCELCGLQSK